MAALKSSWMSRIVQLSITPFLLLPILIRNLHSETESTVVNKVFCWLLDTLSKVCQEDSCLQEEQELGQIFTWGYHFFVVQLLKIKVMTKPIFGSLTIRFSFNWYTQLFSGADLLDNHLTLDLVTMSLWFLAIQHLYWII